MFPLTDNETTPPLLVIAEKLGPNIGFSVGGAPTLQEAPTYDLQFFLKKCTKLRKFWTKRGEGHVQVDPPLYRYWKQIYILDKKANPFCSLHIFLK